jgi:TPP-dependent pyruvate/acetoin dehydrogenase alpha subunit
MIIWDRQASNEEKAQAIEEAIQEAIEEAIEEQEEQEEEEEGSFLRNEFGLGQ